MIKIANEEGLNIKVQNNLVGSVVSQEMVDKIIYLILNTKLSYRKIAKISNVNLNTVIYIKNGVKKYRRNNLKYPLRHNN